MVIIITAIQNSGSTGVLNGGWSGSIRSRFNVSPSGKATGSDSTFQVAFR
jgi:hypothetical protein